MENNVLRPVRFFPKRLEHGRFRPWPGPPPRWPRSTGSWPLQPWLSLDPREPGMVSGQLETVNRPS